MIKVDNLTSHYGKKEILHSLSFHVEKGDFYALMGANGSGKTTLLKCISKMLPVPEGRIELNGKEINRYSAKHLAQNLSVVSQRQHIDFEFSAQDMVMMGRNPYQKKLQNDSEEDRKIVEEVMRKTDTWHLKDAAINKISGGEYQRVILARAMAQRTPVLLLDEPLSNLDVSHQFEIISMLKELNRREGTTIMLIIHDLNLALEFCDKLMLLKEGKILFDGKTENGLTSSMIADAFDVNSSPMEVAGRKVILLSKK